MKIKKQRYSQERIGVANRALKLIAPTKAWEFFIGYQGLRFRWTDRHGGIIDRRWGTLCANDSYPAFWRALATGDTCCAAITQLARWIQGRTVHPFTIWRLWTGENYKIAGDKNKELLDTLKPHWPQEAICVRCQKPIRNGYDWYGYGANSGPGHLDCFGLSNETPRSL
jgi:hypothetical protein